MMMRMMIALVAKAELAKKQKEKRRSHEHAVKVERGASFSARGQ